MSALHVAFLFTGLLLSQTKPEGQTADKPDPKVKARQLLETAVGTLGSAQPEVQAVALTQLGVAYRAFSKKKALEFLQQAFDVAGALPAGAGGRSRSRLQVETVRSVADLDVSEAIRMLRAMPATGSTAYDLRVWAAYRIVEVLLAKDQIDPAIEVVNSLGSNGAYPFGAASLIFAKLPDEDSRRITLFGSAMAAYAARPDRAFVQMLARHWRRVPRRMAESALDSVLKQTLETKTDQGFEMLSISTESATVSLRSAQDADLFELIEVIRALEPKRAEEILAARRELKSVLEAHPQGAQSIKGANTTMIKTGSRNPPQAANPMIREQLRAASGQQLMALAATRSAAALAALKDDPQRAVSAAKLIPIPSRQAEVLGVIARSVGEKDPATARSVLNQCLALVADLKEPADRIGPWDSIADAAYVLGDDKLVAEAIEKGMADAAELYKKDTNTDSPNTRPPQDWPSTMAFLRIIGRATRLLGVASELLLLKISDPDLNLLARIEMANRLLGRPEQRR